MYYISASVSYARHFCIWHTDEVYAIGYMRVWLIFSVTHASGQGEPIVESSALGLGFHVCCRCEMMLLLSKRGVIGAVLREVSSPSCVFFFFLKS